MKPETTNPLALSGLPPALRWGLARLTRLGRLRDWYDEWAVQQLAPGTGLARAFLDFTLDKLGAEAVVVNPERLEAVPETGALIAVANHPLGGLDGMLLTRMLLSRRPDLKVLVNGLLLRFPEFRELFIGVDVLSSDRRQANARGLRAASRHLAAGGALLVFPAGTVSQLQLRGWRLRDPDWNPMIGRLALRHRAACLPLHVQARNGWAFYLSDRIHPRLRTLLLPRAMQARRRAPVRVRVGGCIESARLQALGGPAQVAQYLRVSCELLGESGDNAVAPPPVEEAGSGAVRPGRPPLAAGLDRLAPWQVAQQGRLAVYCAPWEALGGRLAEQLALARETTFRAAGEGTGQALDRDRFDPHYWHIWAWDAAAGRVVGGYRVARVDAVVAAHGLEGLYSHSLFHYDRGFLQALGGAVEVGRSYVTAPYQGNPRALDLLWRGIGAYVVRHPDCHTLFGCVSISRRYSPLARALLAETLLSHHTVDAALRALVRPVAPVRRETRPWGGELLSALSSMTAVNKLLGSAQAGARVPALIRHYLALNGKFVDFSLNHGFNQALDGLIIVDLREAPRRYLQRYLGREGMEACRRKWSVSDAA